MNLLLDDHDLLLLDEEELFEKCGVCRHRGGLGGKGDADRGGLDDENVEYVPSPEQSEEFEDKEDEAAVKAHGKEPIKPLLLFDLQESQGRQGGRLGPCDGPGLYCARVCWA